MADEYQKTVFAVVFGNYEPPEVLGLYENRDAAEEHAKRAGAMAEVREMELILGPPKVGGAE